MGSGNGLMSWTVVGVEFNALSHHPTQLGQFGSGLHSESLN